jgi:hypothetical protein
VQQRFCTVPLPGTCTVPGTRKEESRNVVKRSIVLCDSGICFFVLSLCISVSDISLSSARTSTTLLYYSCSGLIIRRHLSNYSTSPSSYHLCVSFSLQLQHAVDKRRERSFAIIINLSSSNYLELNRNRTNFWIYQHCRQLLQENRT